MDKFLSRKTFRKIIKHAKKYRLYHKSEKDAFVATLPKGVPTNEYSAKNFYPYLWFSENVKYFGLSLVPYKTRFRRNKLYYLGYPVSFAILPLSYTFDDYFNSVIKSAERALIRKAVKNGFYCNQISYDDYLDEIKEINTSKETRCGRPMSEDYLNPRKRDCIVKSFNQNIFTYGIFSKDNKLVAYYMFELITNFFHVVKGIGHSDFLKYGIMNYLFAFSVGELTKMNLADTMIYGLLPKQVLDGLSRFKENVGCNRKYVILRCTRQQKSTLDYFIDNYELHGDTALNYVVDYIKVN